MTATDVAHLSGRGRPATTAAGVFGAAACAAVVAWAAAQGGLLVSGAVAVLLVGLAAAVVLWIAWLRPSGLVPRPVAPPPTVRLGRFASGVALLGCAALAGGLAWAAAQLGLLATAGVVVLLGLAVAGVAVWRLWIAPHRLVQLPASLRGGLRVRPHTSALLVLVTAGTVAAVAWVAPQGGMKGMAIILGGAVLAVCLVTVRDRALLVLGLTVFALAVMLHKSFGPIKAVNSGAPSINVTTIDALLVVLYAIWLADGTLRSDLKAGLRRPVMWIPLVGAFLAMFSMLVASNTYLVFTELFRMAWMYLLFVYVALRVRTARQVWFVLGAMASVGLLEVVVVLGQWATGGSLGLSFLGVPKDLGARVVDATQIGRPFGTIIHPTFMGTFMGMLALMALSLAINLREKPLRIGCAVLAGLFAAPLAISQTRAAGMGLVAAGAILIVTSIARRRLSVKVVLYFAAVLGIIGVAMWPQIRTRLFDNFGTDHFRLEVESRTQLNDLAFTMMYDAPVAGVGLNNFQQVMDRYDTHGVIFSGNPVHNILLLTVVETGFIGLAGFLLVGASLALVSVRLARVKDPLYAAIGTGFATCLVFLLVEEQLNFSLRIDQPLALFWILAGLCVACARLSGWPHKKASSRPIATRPVKVAAAFSLIPVAAAGVGPGPLAARPPKPPQIVFAAVPRSGGHQGIYVADADGSNVHKITPDDDLDYSWPTWAFGGNKIVYTARAGSAGSPEEIYLMNPDGSGSQQLTKNPWRNVQPKVTPDGRSVIFTSRWDEFPQAGIYRLDLKTLQVTNLSAVTSPAGAVDSDPRVSPDGTLIAFASTVLKGQGEVPTQDSIMNLDGTDRRRITQDQFYNTDPALSPDNTKLAIASYRGPGAPSAEDPNDPFRVKLQDFRLVVRDVAGDAETELTSGQACAERPAAEPCAPADAPAYVPVWTPDGTGVGYIGILASNRVCICVANADGSGARAIVSRTDLQIRYFDWVVPAEAPATLGEVGTAVPQSRLLFGGTNEQGLAVLQSSTPDRWVATSAFASLLQPVFARWTPDRKRIVFTARVDFDTKAFHPGPPPPPGQQVHEHYTLDFLSGLMGGPPPSGDAIAKEQVFIVDADGKNLRKLTTPWTEDYMDALNQGDARGNVAPDVSPDGRHVVFTSRSTISDESSLLRLDLDTGSVYSLTNATAGAVPTIDADPRYSPDGGTIAFTTMVGGTRQIMLMDAADGRNVRKVTDDDYINTAPAWSPDGRSLVYASYRGGLLPPTEDEIADGRAKQNFLHDWYLVKVDVATGRQTVLTQSSDSPTLRPVWSPDGSAIAYIGVNESGQPDVFTVSPDGGPPHLVQATLTTRELFLDWR